MQNRIFRGIGWIAVVIFILLGLLLDNVLTGYHFSAFVCFGIAFLIVCYLLLGVLAKKHHKHAKILLIVLSVCVGVGIIAAAITGGVIVHAAAGQVVDCDYVVVLGAGVNGTVPSLSLQDRLDAAYAYMTAYPNAICVVSGGQGNGEDITEAECMFRDLTARGIDPSRVWKEEKATSTRENIRYSLDIIEERTGKRLREIGLVSSEYHLYRANLFAEEENVKAYGIPARTSWVSLRINYYLREIAAVWYYTIF